MHPVDRALRRFFRVKKRDNLPYTGWKQSTRKDIYEFMASYGGFNLGAEIGVERGINARTMLKVMPELKLILVDPWGPYHRVNEERAQRRFDSCVKRLSGYVDRLDYIREESQKAVLNFPNGSLDFVYIDGLHDFDSVIKDIIAWVPKVREGGLIAGHDYFNSYQFGVVTAVDAYIKAHNIRDFYITVADKYPSWFWVNK